LDINEYISSGILEQYVLGSVSSKEKQEVECMASIYPEIKSELEALQSTLEIFALQSEVSPPPKLKGEVLRAIAEVDQIKDDDISSASKVAKPSSDHAQVIRLSRRWAAVGAVLIVSSLAALMFFNYESQENLIALKDELNQNDQIISEQAQNLEALRQDYGQLASVNSVLTNPNTQRVEMQGTEMFPDGVAQVYWNTEDQQIVMDRGNMPPPPEDQDYQLWAIVDGTPTSLGVYPWSEESSEPAFMSGEIEKASAFAVTIEPKGGSETPTLSKLFVIGEV